MSAALKVDRITLAYEEQAGLRVIVEGFCLDLAVGAIGCLLGPSGCGKSSVLRAIAGFEPVRAGAILLDNTPISSPTVHLPPEQRKVGLMFQEYALFPHLTAAQNIGFGLRLMPRAERHERVAAMLALIGLPAVGPRFPHELSGGQQQRVALARALAPEPALLLLDEPFSNLDTGTRERLTEEVRQILKLSGQTALLVSHNEGEAGVFSDQVCVMQARA